MTLPNFDTVGPTYYLTDDVRLTVRYNFVNHFPDEMHPNESQNRAYRPFQQIQWYTRFPPCQINAMGAPGRTVSAKPEQRCCFADGYNFNWQSAITMPYSSL